MLERIETPTKTLSTPQPALLWNVPSPLTSLIGREQTIAQISALLSNSQIRLVTLLGPGGIGKTRLSIEVATHLRPLFADGASFVSLAAIHDPAQLLFAIAQALDIQEKETQPITELLMAYLRTKHLLLLLDNFEQLLPAVLTLSDLLEACPHLKIVVTSRAALRIQGEQEFLLQPLTLPPLDRLPDPETLTQYTSVTLFLQRVQALVPAFQLSQTNARAIAEICVQLDGLPLALELAAARIKLLSPQALLTRLSRRLQVLTGGARTLPVRQQTLYNTLKWSYDLLDPQEQHLFQRLSIFVNGCSLQAIEYLYTTFDADTGQVLDGVTSLIDKCLLQKTGWDDPDPRLLMLETIREYGLECLAASGEMVAVRTAHASYYLALAEEIEPKLDGEEQAMWMEQLERERGNLRAAFLWLTERAEHEQGENQMKARTMALRLAGALRRFWLGRGCLNDEQQCLEQALARNEPIPAQVRAKALLTLGMLLSLQGNYNREEELYTECLALFRQLRDPRSIATALYQLGRIAWMRGDLTAARTLAEEALLHSRESGHKGSIAWSRFRLARLVIEQGEYARGQTLLEENLAMHQETGNKRGMASSLYHLAWVHLVSQNDPDTTHSLITGALTLFREIGDKEGIAYSFYLSGWLALSQDDPIAALASLQESVALFRKISHREGIAWALSLSGKAMAARGNYTTAYAFYKEGIEIASKLDHKGLLATCLEGLASMVATRIIPEELGEEHQETELPLAHKEPLPNIWWAARLWGRAETLRLASDIPMLPIDRTAYKRAVALARKQLGEESFSIAWTEGRNLSSTQILQVQKRGSIAPQIPSINQTPPSRSTPPAGLTAREVEVLRLVAQGLTSAQIAEQLILSLLTVNSHVRSIYSKLAVTSRSAATRYAIEHQLV